jgi:hypothetical protein
MKKLIAGGAVLAGVMIGSTRGDAHKPITSKYTYSEDVYPVFRDRCGACHVAGGAAPMSLLTYEDAVPWAVAIRDELVLAHMPPWDAEEGVGQFSNAHTISAAELDTILVWANGGTPQGDRTRRLPTPVLANSWSLGPPDVTLQMPSAFTLGPQTQEDTQEFVLQTGDTKERWIRAVDLLPGTPAIVRNAVLRVRLGSDRGQTGVGLGSDWGQTGVRLQSDPEILMLWTPGERPVPTPAGAAFHVPEHAELVLRIHYKKTWQYEGKEVTDRSTVGLYLAGGTGGRPVRPLTLTRTAPLGRTATFSRTIDRTVQALALRADANSQNVTLQVEAVAPNGSRLPMIRLRTRPDWQRRYWFARPLTLLRGSRVDVTATPADEAHADAAPIHVTLDVVAR